MPQSASFDIHETHNSLLKHGHTALNCSIEYCRIETILKIIKVTGGIPPDSVIMAILLRKHDILQILIKNIENVNSPEPITGFTPMQVAKFINDDDSIEILKKNGANF